MKPWITWTIAVIFVGGMSWAAAEKSRERSLDPAPLFTLPNLTGKPVNLSEFKGKVVILDFWATWCPPCRQEIPDFVKLADIYRDRGLAIVGVALDQGGARDVAPFYQKYKMNYTTLIGNDKVTEDYGGIRGIPTTFVLTPDLKVYRQYVGFRPREVFEKDIEALLPQVPRTTQTPTPPHKSRKR